MKRKTKERTEQPLDGMPEPIINLSECKQRNTFQLAPTLEANLICQLVEHAEQIPHFARDVINGVEIQYRW